MLAPTDDRSTLKPTLGQYLASIRTDRKMTLREVEEATDKQVSNAYLSQIERDVTTAAVDERVVDEHHARHGRRIEMAAVGAVHLRRIPRATHVRGRKEHPRLDVAVEVVGVERGVCDDEVGARIDGIAGAPKHHQREDPRRGDRAPRHGPGGHTPTINLRTVASQRFVGAPSRPPRGHAPTLPSRAVSPWTRRR